MYYIVYLRALATNIQLFFLKLFGGGPATGCGCAPPLQVADGGLATLTGSYPFVFFLFYFLKLIFLFYLFIFLLDFIFFFIVMDTCRLSIGCNMTD